MLFEEGELRAYGAGLLSSYGEIEEFRGAEIRPLRIADMGVQKYDITHYQPILFAADGIEHLLDVVGGFFAGCDDDSPARLGPPPRARLGGACRWEAASAARLTPAATVTGATCSVQSRAVSPADSIVNLLLLARTRCHTAGARAGGVAPTRGSASTPPAGWRWAGWPG